MQRFWKMWLIVVVFLGSTTGIRAQVPGALQLSTLCAFHSGPLAGSVVDYAGRAMPIPVGAACTDGVGSFGYAIAPPSRIAPPAPVPNYGSSMDEFRDEHVRLALQAINNPAVQSRVQQLWVRLVQYSHQMYAVLPAQQFTMGQALPNGTILLDLSAAGDPHPEVTAFWLAHEWGHQVLGHTQLLVSRWGPWIVAQGGTAFEDDADRWSARFLKAEGMDVAPVLERLCSLPSGPPGDTHSTGAQRAAIVAQAYGGVESPCGAPHSGDTPPPVFPGSGFVPVLDQLVSAAPLQFRAYRGAQEPYDPDIEEYFYQLTITVPGVSDCNVMVNAKDERDSSVVCTAYRGESASEAALSYRRIQQELTAYAAARQLQLSESQRPDGYQSELLSGSAKIRLRYTSKTFASSGRIVITVKLWIDAG